MSIQRIKSDVWRSDAVSFSVRRDDDIEDGALRIYTGVGVEIGMPHTRAAIRALIALLERAVAESDGVAP